MTHGKRKVKRMRQLWIMLGILILMIAACDSGSSQSGSPAPITPPATLDPNSITATAIVRQATANAGFTTPTCEMGLITETSDDAITELQTAMDEREIEVSSINVLITSDRQSCTSVTILNTFVSVRLPVDDVSDDDSLGNVAADVLQAFVNIDLPQPATISLQFEAGTRQRALTVNHDEALEYLADDLQGAELVETIEG